MQQRDELTKTSRDELQTSTLRVEKAGLGRPQFKGESL